MNFSFIAIDWNYLANKFVCFSKLSYYCQPNNKLLVRQRKDYDLLLTLINKEKDFGDLMIYQIIRIKVVWIYLKL